MGGVGQEDVGGREGGDTGSVPFWTETFRIPLSYPVSSNNHESLPLWGQHH